MVDQHPIVLLGHSTVIATQTGLDMYQGCLRGVGGEAPGQSGVGISLDDHRQRAQLREAVIEGRDRQSDLLAPRLPAHAEIGLWLCEVESIEECPREAAVVVLATVQYHGGRAQEPDHMGELDDLGPRPEHDGHRARRQVGHGSR